MSVQLKRNSNAGTVPTAGQLLDGEIAINTADGIAFLKKDDGTIVQIGATAINVPYTGLTGTVPIWNQSTTGNALTATAASTLATSALAVQSTVPAGTGVTPTVQVICPSAAFTLLNQTATQPVFNTPQDTISLQAATTYIVEGQYLLQTGTTSHTTTISFVSSVAITAPDFAYTTIASMHSSANASTRTQETSFFTSISGGIVYQSGVLPNMTISFRGIIRTTDAGNLVPNLSFGNAPSATNYVLVGSYIVFYPVGSNTISSIGTAIS